MIKEREKLKEFFKRLNLPCDTLNKEASATLADYEKGGEFKLDACIKIATTCNDESTCLEVARSFFAKGDYYSAKQWLQKGNIDSSNHLYHSKTG